MDTLLLDLTNWDLVVDAAGNWAKASAPYAISQDVASAIKTFAGEVWYNSTKGIPYFAQILGQSPPVSLLQEFMVRAALTVPLVVDNPPPQCVITSFELRNVKGQVSFTDSAGNTQTVSL